MDYQKETGLKELVDEAIRILIAMRELYQNSGANTEVQDD